MKGKYEVVISGMAGRFPESYTVEEFHNNLLNKVDMITKDDRRWKDYLTGPLKDVPGYTGKVPGRDEMDMTYFGLHRRLCVATDPQQRLSLELSTAAVIDAGVNPVDLWGSNTAVVAASVLSETEYEMYMATNSIGISLIGQARCFQANRISVSMNLNGPSLTLDSSWNSGLEGIAYAAYLISTGKVPSAIVVVSNLLYTAEASYHYLRMGRLASAKGTRSFSNDAEGYNRSEGVVAFFLQRKEDAIRSYGTLLTVNTNCLGSKQEPITEISMDSFGQYFKKLYEENTIDPNSIAFIEASGTASKIIDAAELNVLGEVLAKNRKKPLLVGSVKSNVGHAEAAAAAVSLAKALLISNYGIIYPNLHYSEPNDMVPYLSEGSIKVVTEPTPIEGDIIGVMSFGCLASFSHLLIKRNPKRKSRIPEKNVLPPDGLPRLFIISGRNEDKLKEVLMKVEEKPIDEEYIAITNHIFKKGVKKHTHRGYSVLNDKNKIARNTQTFFTGGQPVKPIWFVFTGMGSQWPGMGAQLMKIPIFAKAIHRCHEVLRPKGLDLINIITTQDPEIFNNILHSFVGIASIQIALVDILSELGIKPDGIIGHSVGELGCAYADGCFTAEQMILAAYARGKASIETDLIPGMMAAVGKGYAKIKNDLPEGIEVACHNSAESCTLSGPTKIMEEYVELLIKKNIFAKLVNVSNIAYHSKYIRPAAPALLKYLKEVIPDPKLRSSKWISTSVPESDWDKESAKYCSAEYHTNNLLGSVLFEEGAKHIPPEAVIIEIAPHGLLQAILKRSFPNAVHVPLTNRRDTNNLIFFMNALGLLYLEGIEMDLEKLYPPIEFPVSCGTPCLDELIVWDHSENWRIGIKFNIESFDCETTQKYVKSRSFIVNKVDEEFKYLNDYKLHGYPTIFLAFYMNLAINDYKNLHDMDEQIIMMKNIKLYKYLEILKEVDLYVSLGKGSGYWEICKSGEKIASGEILTLLSEGLNSVGHLACGPSILDEEFYNYFNHMGHDIGPSFKVIKSVRLSTSEVSAIVQWNGNLAVFLDAILKLPALLHSGKNKLCMVTEIKQLVIESSKFKKNECKDLQVYYNSQSGKLECDGLEILYPKCSEPSVSPRSDRRILYQELKFMPYEAPDINDTKLLLELCINILWQKMEGNFRFKSTLTIIEVKEKLDFHHELYEIVKWRNDHNIQMIITESDECLEGYSMNSNSDFSLILTESNQIVNSINILKQSRNGLILFVGDQITPLPSYLSLIFTKTLGKEKFTLCSLRRKLDENIKYISMESTNWKDQIQRKLKETHNEVIFLAGEVTSVHSINEILNQCQKLPNSQMLRYIFIDSDISKFQPMNFREQLEKDLHINIMRNGKWGLCLFQPRDIIIDDQSSMRTVYKFSDIRIEGNIEPKALGLNFTDLTNSDIKLEVNEFSGISKFKEVCGLGRLTLSPHVIKTDPLYIWEKPEGWTHEDVAAVLMPYAMAYYVLNQSFNFKTKLNSLLIHHGGLPLSQAMINVALSFGRTIYTTYENDTEKNLIMKIFPQIPERNIINLNSQFENVILEETNSNGVSTIVNTLPGKKFLDTSLKCLSYEGVFFQMDPLVFRNEDSIGLGHFLQFICVAGLSSSLMFCLQEDEKHYIQTAIKEGFQNGVIKPFSTFTLSSLATNVDAKKIISSNSLKRKKAVVSMEKKFEKISTNSFFCDQRATYLIIGTQHKLWLDLVEWLSKKGAQQIHILNNENMLNGVGIQKLNDLLLENPYFRCCLTPKSILSNLKTTQQYIDLINKKGKLDTIFILGHENDDITHLLNQISKERVVVMSENADVICEERINSGLPTLAISLPSNLLTPYEVLPRLNTLLVAALHQQTLFVSEEWINNNIDVETKGMENFNHLPQNVKEVLALGSRQQKASWKEVRSSSLPFKYNHEIPPVFVLPALRSWQMDTIIKSLFFPTFVATLPNFIQDFEEVACQLYKDIERFNIGVFTIICSNWSWPIGIHLAKLLENNKKEVSLILLGSNITWSSEKAYKLVLNKVKKDFVDNLTKDEKERQRVKLQKALQNLKHLQNLFVSKSPSKSPKIKGICHYLKHSGMLRNEALAQLQEYFDQTINVFTSEETDFPSMLTDRKIMNHINSCIQFHYKDEARKMEKIYMKKRIYENPRLAYMSLMESYENSVTKGGNEKNKIYTRL